MDAKLTLKIDKEAIDAAKEYASENNRSLSSLVESYFHALKAKKVKKEEVKISPFVKSLSIKSGIPADYDYKKALGDYYSEKYK